MSRYSLHTVKIGLMEIERTWKYSNIPPLAHYVEVFDKYQPKVTSESVPDYTKIFNCKLGQVALKRGVGWRLLQWIKKGKEIEPGLIETLVEQENEFIEKTQAKFDNLDNPMQRALYDAFEGRMQREKELKDKYYEGTE